LSFEAGYVRYENPGPSPGRVPAVAGEVQADRVVSGRAAVFLLAESAFRLLHGTNFHGILRYSGVGAPTFPSARMGTGGGHRGGGVLNCRGGCPAQLLVSP